MAFFILHQLSQMYEDLGIDKTAADFKPDVIDPIVAGRTDPNEIEDSFEEAENGVSNLDMMRLSCAYAVGALGSLAAGDSENSWVGIAHGQYWMGVAFGTGFIKGARKEALSGRAAAGGLARSAKFEPLRQFARQLAAKRGYKSRLSAAVDIEKEVIAEAVRLEIEVQGDTFYRRIYGWLEGVPFKRDKSKKDEPFA
jgi:hypothetical protein